MARSLAPLWAAALAAALAAGGGCKGPCVAPAAVPHELAKYDLAEYVIEPPDVLLIDVIRAVPRPPYRIEPLDVLAVQVTDTLPNEPISGLLTVSPEGALLLGYNYGAVPAVGLTLDEARAAVEKQLKPALKPGFAVTLSLAQPGGVQMVRGEHLVATDGTIGLGTYGAVKVSGLTVRQARAAVEEHLSELLLNPRVSVRVAGYNSKVYYVITDGAGLGEQVTRLPLTGHETVLDAISQVAGLPPVSSKKCIWVARPTADGHGGDAVLPVDWIALTQRGAPETNYQLLPGDRVYVNAKPLTRLDYTLARVLSPVERLLGVTLLGSATVRSFGPNANNGGFGGF